MPEGHTVNPIAWVRILQLIGSEAYRHPPTGHSKGPSGVAFENPMDL
jgi:hypothetical protein